MKKKKQKLLLAILPFLCLNKVYASCTQEEIDNFKQIEDEYKVTYEMDTETKKYVLFISNPEPEKYGYILKYNNEDNSTTTLELFDVKENEFTMIDFSSGEYTIQIQGITTTCNEKLKETTLKLAKYNKYSEDSLCEGIEEFVLCQSTYDKDIDYDTFKSRVETYKKTKENQLDENDEQTEENQFKIILNKSIDFLKQNILIIIASIIIVILLIAAIILSLKSLRKRRRLE